jgi:hypothetical protein
MNCANLLHIVRNLIQLAAQCNPQGRVAIATNPDAALHAAQRGLCLQQLKRGGIKRKLVPSPSITQFQESIELEAGST